MLVESSPSLLPPPDVLRHVVDVHCHPTDSDITAQAMDHLAITICAMSSRPADQHIVRDLARAYPDKVIPCFGYHPWFSHWISIVPGISREEHYRQLFSPSAGHQDSFDKLLPHLPDPIPLTDVLAEVRQNLSTTPQAMLGEVGLDRAVRVPMDYTGTPRELTPFTIPLEHQLAVLEPQLGLAVELRRNVSIHSVKSQQATLDLLNRMHQKYGSDWQCISIDLHSCGLSVETWKAIEKRHSNVYMSLSTVINGRSPNYRALIEECAGRTWDMVLTIAEIKGWAVETTWVEDLQKEDWGVVRRLRYNWQEFQTGNHSSAMTGQTNTLTSVCRDSTSGELNYCMK